MACWSKRSNTGLWVDGFLGMSHLFSFFKCDAMVSLELASLITWGDQKPWYVESTSVMKFRHTESCFGFAEIATNCIAFLPKMVHVQKKEGPNQAEVGQSACQALFFGPGSLQIDNKCHNSHIWWLVFFEARSPIHF